MRGRLCDVAGTDRVSRTAETLKTKYENIKKRTKEKIGVQKTQTNQTGGGSPQVIVLNQTENQIADLITNRATGDVPYYDNDNDAVQQEGPFFMKKKMQLGPSC